eukprot:3586054-Amphidinium_carterae.1
MNKTEGLYCTQVQPRSDFLFNMKRPVAQCVRQMQLMLQPCSGRSTSKNFTCLLYTSPSPRDRG